MNTYRNPGGRPVLELAPGAVGELELTVEEEASLLAQGRLQIEPREYEVIGTRAVHGARPGEKFHAGLRIEHERALIEGGHIERAAAKKKPGKPANDKE
jgi:hypothetical protein